MKKSAGIRMWAVVVALACMVAWPLTQATAGVEAGTEHPWSVSFGGGLKDFEGDQALDDSPFISGTISYDYSERWTFEGVLLVLPNIDGQEYESWQGSHGQWLPQPYTVNRLEEQSDGDATSTSGIGLGLDCLFHLTRWERLDPYFVLGGGLSFYADDFEDSNGADPQINGGAGVMYHFNDEWAVRGDFRTFLTGLGGVEANSIINAGVVYTLGARVGPEYDIKGGKDSDGDGLTDEEETGIYHTDPGNPDTDGDDLTDWEEVKQYNTNPLDRDTDMDLLTDGEEVHAYRTDPLDADTDDGGVWDGHEVLEDSTDPLNGKDDLVLFRLNIEFETDKSVIKPEYFQKLNIIAKVLKRNPGATAKIEGHADRRRTSKADYNLRLSDRRAHAVLKYIAERKIDAGRLSAKGFGFSRPIAPNDPANGNIANRRVDVYIRGVGENDPIRMNKQFDTDEADLGGEEVAPAPVTKETRPATDASMK